MINMWTILGILSMTYLILFLISFFLMVQDDLEDASFLELLGFKGFRLTFKRLQERRKR